MRKDDVRSLIETHGVAGFTREYCTLLEEKKINPWTQSIRALYEGLMGDPSRSLHDDMTRLEMLDDTRPLREDVTAGAFSIITGSLLSSVVIPKFDDVAKKMDQLFTKFTSTQKTDTIPGFTETDDPVELNEREPYPDAGLAEKYVTMGAQKEGRMISLTEEAILHDQTNMLLIRAQDIAERTAQIREKKLARIISDSDTKTWYPANTATAFWASGTGGNCVTNSLTSNASITAARTKLLGQTGDRGMRIEGTIKIIAVPEALLVTALEILNSQLIPKSSNNDINVWNASSGAMGAGIQVVSSQWFDALSTTTWFAGDFKRQFYEKVIWPIQVMRAPKNNGEDFSTDVVARFKVRRYGAAGALTNKFVIKNHA